MISIVIVSFNTAAMTIACLRSVIEQTRLEGVEVIVVDNASTDGSADAISRESSRIRLIQAERNLGFAAANNLACKEATGEYLLLLNPDTVVLDNAIGKLLAFAEAHPDAGIWGGRTVFEDGRLNPSSCWRESSLWSMLSAAVGLSSVFPRSSLFNPEAYGSWKRDTVRRIDIVTGCFLLIRRELWDRLGGFDPAFFMYGEDADLCLRARKLGARPMFTPEATIIHHGGASEPVRSDKLVRLLSAWTVLIRRHWHPALAPIGVALLMLCPLSRAVAWRVLSLVKGGAALQSAACWTNVWHRRREWVPAI